MQPTSCARSEIRTLVSPLPHMTCGKNVTGFGLLQLPRFSEDLRRLPCFVRFLERLKGLNITATLLLKFVTPLQLISGEET